RPYVGKGTLGPSSSGQKLSVAIVILSTCTAGGGLEPAQFSPLSGGHHAVRTQARSHRREQRTVARHQRPRELGWGAASSGGPGRAGVTGQHGGRQYHLPWPRRQLYVGPRA